MLEAFVMINQESIKPIGGTLCTLESDFSWKRKKQAVGTKPPANNYNLVQLKSVDKGIKKFSIQELPTDLTDSSHSRLKNTTECKKEVNLDDKSSEHNATKPKHTRPLCSQMFTMPLADVFPMPCSIPESMKQETNPQYVNTMKNKPYFLAGTSDDSVECAQQYENCPGIELLQSDVSSDHKFNTSEYVNW